MAVTLTIEIGNTGGTKEGGGQSKEDRAVETKREVEEHIAAAKEKLSTAVDQNAINEDKATALDDDLHRREEKALGLTKASDLNPLANVKRAYHTHKIDNIGDTAQGHITRAELLALAEDLKEDAKKCEAAAAAEQSISHE